MLVLLAAWFCTSVVEDPTLDEVLHRHQQYLDRLHTLKATVEAWDSRDGGKTWSLAVRFRWFKDGPRERYTSQASGYTDPSGRFQAAEIRAENSFSPVETRMLTGWNAEHPPSEPPSPLNNFHGAAARIGSAPTNGSISGSPPAYMLLSPTPFDYLPGAVQAASRPSLSKITLNGRDCWEVSFKSIDGLPASYRVALDPARGYAIVRVVSLTSTKPTQGGVSEAIAFREVEDGLFIPILIRGSFSHEPGHITERRVTELNVNQPIADGDLLVRFPEDMGVMDTREGSQFVFHIWGIDGPKRTIRSSAEYQAFLRNGFRHKQPVPPWAIGLMIASALAVVLLLMFRSRLRRAQAD